MLQFITEDQQVRKKVFFKPELSSQIKFTSMISPQFINDTNILYMSAYDFISYNTDEESFSLIHRPLPPQNESKNSTQEFINVNFGHDGRQRVNEMFYLTKTVTLEEDLFYLGRRLNSLNTESDRRLIARNKRNKKKKFTISDLDNRGNVKTIRDSVTSDDDDLPNNILEFKKEFIVKPNAGLIIFVVRKEVKQPQLKLSVKQIPQEDEQDEFNEDIEYKNPSPPSSTQIIIDKPQSNKEKEFKNHLLIHSFSRNQTMTFELDQSIQSAFDITEASPNIVCVTQKHVYLLNFEVKNAYSASNVSTSNFDLGGSDSFESKKRGYLNSHIKVEVLDKVQLQFQIKNEGSIPSNLCMFKPTQNRKDSTAGDKKRGKRHQSISHNSIVRDKRVSSLIKPKDDTNKPQTNFFCNPSMPGKTNDNSSRFAHQNPSSLARSIEQKIKDQPYQQIKKIKKAFKVLPISFHNEEFIMIVYVISKVLCTPDSIEPLSYSYETNFFSIHNFEMTQIDVIQQYLNNGGENSGNNPNMQSEKQRDDFNSDFTNLFEFVNEVGDISVNKGVILIWQKMEPVIHEITFKVDYYTTEMLDLSEPKNLKTQKSLGPSISYLLTYQNKITLHLNSNLIRQIIISPTCQNFLILTGRNYLKNNYRESETEEIDTKPEDLDQKYDVTEYLIFQYDLFRELWSSDANVYLKSMPVCYHKRNVDEIAPFRMKNEILALTGKKVHEMHKSLLDGILCFDLHPYGYFIAVSFGFNAKIYSLQHSRLNLIYTYNSQNIKKLKYSPNGSDLIIMSHKHIKVLDSFSFSIKYILQEKSTQCSFTNFAHSHTGMEFYTVYDNVFINVHNGLSYAKTGSIKPGQSSLLTLHDKIVTVIPDSEQKFCMALLENGKLYFKWYDDVITIQHEKIYKYEDEKMIKTLHYDAKRGVLFCGLQNGVVRSHIWPIKNEASYNFNLYSEFKFSYNLITCLRTSFLTNTLYIGDQKGNLTIAKFIIEKQKKITGQIRPTNYYIFSTHSPLVNMPRTELQALQKCYKYALSSNTTSLAENPQKLKLQYKLNEIIARMNEQMKKFKQNMRDKLVEKEGMAKGKLNFNALYNETKSKLTGVSHEIKIVKENQAQEKSLLTAEYETKLKDIIEEQNELIKAKGLQLSKNFMAKALLKQMHLNIYNTLKEKEQNIELQYSNKGAQGLNLMIREQELVPYDEIDYLPNDRIDIKKELVKKLDADLKKEKQRNFQLKQKCTYMENSKNNLQTGQIKEETLIFRINIELQEMQAKLQFQNNVHSTVAHELKEAEQKINKIQENVVQRNPQFTKVVNGSSEGDDACNYKIWVKDKMSRQVDLLHNHFMNLDEIMEQKQLDIIEMVAYRKKCVDALESTKIKKEKIKQYLHFLKEYLSNVKNKTDQLKYKCAKHEYLDDKHKLVKPRKDTLQKENNKDELTEEKKEANDTKGSNLFASNLLNKKTKSSKKIHKKYLSSTITPNDQDTIVQQTEQAHRIFLQTFTKKKIVQNEIVQTVKQNHQLRNTSKRELSVQMRKKMHKMIQDIDEKVKNEWINLESEKLSSSPATPFKSSSTNCLSRRLKKLKSQNSSPNQRSFADKLLEKMREKNEGEKENFQGKDDFCSVNDTKKVDRVIPFSATSSPIAKQISSKFNLYEKSSKFLKNNVKISQRKVKRLNGQQAELLSEFQQLRYENKQLADHQDIVKEGIEVYADFIQKTSHRGEHFWNDQENTVNTIRRTPFQKYIEQKNHKISPNKTITNFKELKENFMVSRAKNNTSLRSSRIKLNMTSTGFNTPKIDSSPRKLTERDYYKY